ncbi:MAG: hypothetical protein GF307_10005 [candidate division Zixibacteria bacterium]|nr:hypothetical protein [candidate division Zixibacteria bacterium]
MPKIIFLLIMISALNVYAGGHISKPGKITGNPNGAKTATTVKTPIIILDNPLGGNPGSPYPDSIPPPSMEVSLEWTECKIHQVMPDSGIMLTLPGHVFTTHPLLWELNPANPMPGGQAPLNFIEDVMGVPGSGNNDIPLSWDISLNGGDYQPLRVNPDGKMLVNFPPGDHHFNLRISGCLQLHQQNGYYNLQLEQSFVPEL